MPGSSCWTACRSSTITSSTPHAPTCCGARAVPQKRVPSTNARSSSRSITASEHSSKDDWTKYAPPAARLSRAADSATAEAARLQSRSWARPRSGPARSPRQKSQTSAGNAIRPGPYTGFGMALESHDFQAFRGDEQPRFANRAELECAKLLDYYGVPWEYEPRTFVLETDAEGRVMEAFKPDFYLPEQDLYLEITVMKQTLVTRKNRKLRKLRERYPDVNAKLFYKRDVERLAARLRVDMAS